MNNYRIIPKLEVKQFNLVFSNYCDIKDSDFWRIINVFREQSNAWTKKNNKWKLVRQVS
jgi:hypothetical protein